jgi:hypothetical protein
MCSYGETHGSIHNMQIKKVSASIFLFTTYYIGKNHEPVNRFVVLHGGGDGSRTRVRRPRYMNFYGCSETFKCPQDARFHTLIEG